MGVVASTGEQLRASERSGLARLHRRAWIIAAGVLFAVLLIRVVDLYDLHSATYDEHAHISEPLYWIETGDYVADGFHSPLPRLTIALGPKLAGFDSRAPWFFAEWENQNLDEYWRSLTLARVGVLPFVALLFWTVALWSKTLYGPAGSIFVLAILSFSPTIIGHASLATLDVPGAAGFTLALAALWRWLRKPGPVSAALAGAAAGFAQMTKFSAFGFLLAPAAFVAVSLLVRREVRARNLLTQGLVAACFAFAVIWASYGFEWGTVSSFRHEQAVSAADGLEIGKFFQGRDLPAPIFWKGLVDMAYLQSIGHPAMFLGESGRTGWLAYFPVTLALKATPPLIVLGILGVIVSLRRHGPLLENSGLFLLVTAAGILIVSMPNHLNIGVRHIMPIFPVLALLSGMLFMTPVKLSRLKIISLALLAWHLFESIHAHPDYIAYFTPAARSRDYHYLSDSNLAWGQDQWRLAQWLEAHSNESVHVVGGDGIGLLRFLDWKNGPGESDWLIMDTNVAAIVLTGNPGDWLVPIVRSEPAGRIGRSFLIFRRPLP